MSYMHNAGLPASTGNWALRNSAAWKNFTFLACVQGFYFFYRFQVIHSLDIKVADVIGPFRVHPSADGAAACQGGGGYEEVFVVPDRFIGDMSGQVGGEHPPGLLHCFRVAHPEQVILCPLWIDCESRIRNEQRLCHCGHTAFRGPCGGKAEGGHRGHDEAGPAGDGHPDSSVACLSEAADAIHERTGCHLCGSLQLYSGHLRGHGLHHML